MELRFSVQKMESTKINGMLMKLDTKNIKLPKNSEQGLYRTQTLFSIKQIKFVNKREKKLKICIKRVFHLCHLMKTNLEMMSHFSIKLEDSTMSKKATIRTYLVIHTKIDLNNLIDLNSNITMSNNKSSNRYLSGNKELYKYKKVNPLFIK